MGYWQSDRKWGICHHIESGVLAIRSKVRYWPSDRKLSTCHQIESEVLAIRSKVGYLQSNGAIANVAHSDLDLYFKCHLFSGSINIYNISKTVKASEKCSSMTSVEVDIHY